MASKGAERVTLKWKDQEEEIQRKAEVHGMERGKKEEEKEEEEEEERLLACLHSFVSFLLRARVHSNARARPIPSRHCASSLAATSEM